jgi:fibronectin-binding autotransporter adhesin
LFGLRWASGRLDAESGASVSLGGTLVTATNQTTLLSGAAQWSVYGTPSGAYTVFSGGTVTLTNGAVLTGSINLNQVTLNGDLELTQSYPSLDPLRSQVNGFTVNLMAGSVINGTLTLGDDAGTYYAWLQIGGGPKDGAFVLDSLDGNTVIQFGSHPLNTIKSLEGPSTLTIGPRVMIRGNTYTVGSSLDLPVSLKNVVNLGSLEASSPGGTVTLGAGYPRFSGTWNNQGSIAALKGSQLVMSGAGWSNTGSIAATGASMTLAGGLTNAGTIHLDSASVLSVTNNYGQTAGGTLTIDLGGAVAGTSYGQLRVSGQASLSGVLGLGVVAGFAPKLGDTFEVITWTSESGAFGTINGTAVGPGLVLKPAYQPTGLSLTTSAP